MSDAERTAYANRELEHGARVHRDAARLLSETSDLLAVAAEELEIDRADDYVHLVRVSRRLSSTALLLTGGEQALRDLRKDRPYRRLHKGLLGVAFLLATLGAATVGYVFCRREGFRK